MRKKKDSDRQYEQAVIQFMVIIGMVALIAMAYVNNRREEAKQEKEHVAQSYYNKVYKK
jgi:hypothetical protein